MFGARTNTVLSSLGYWQNLVNWTLLLPQTLMVHFRLPTRYLVQNLPCKKNSSILDRTNRRWESKPWLKPSVYQSYFVSVSGDYFKYVFKDIRHFFIPKNTQIVLTLLNIEWLNSQKWTMKHIFKFCLSDAILGKMLILVTFLQITECQLQFFT